MFHGKMRKLTNHVSREYPCTTLMFAFYSAQFRETAVKIAKKRYKSNALFMLCGKNPINCLQIFKAVHYHFYLER